MPVTLKNSFRQPPSRIVRWYAVPALALVLLCAQATMAQERGFPDPQNTAHRYLAQHAEGPPFSREERQLRRQGRWERLQQMNPEEREQALQRLRRWREATPEQRERIRKRLEHFHKLPPEDRERLIRRREWFRNLPPEERRRLRERWQRSGPGSFSGD